MKNIIFTKMSGAGNDFIVLDKNLNPGLILDPKSIKKLCNRRNGVGADGVIIISDSHDYDFLMEYFNSDGSTGSLCGNGARCAIKFADSTKRMKESKTKFISNGMEYAGEILAENLVRFNFGKPVNLKLNFKVKAGDQLITAHFINTGSPHVVININEILGDTKHPGSGYSNINDVPVFKLGSEIRSLPEFSPEGTNVNFYSVEDDKIFIRTFERGVEDETLACGTGNAATAIILNRVEKISPPINLITRGGDELIVDFNNDKDIISNITLTGPVKIVFTGEILFNNIQN